VVFSRLLVGGTKFRADALVPRDQHGVRLEVFQRTDLVRARRDPGRHGADVLGGQHDRDLPGGQPQP
jgi:hypothetical protein